MTTGEEKLRRDQLPWGNGGMKIRKKGAGVRADNVRGRGGVNIERNKTGKNVEEKKERRGGGGGGVYT